MLSSNKIGFLGVVACRIFKANFSLRACRNAQNLHCSNHNCTVLSNGSNWTINETLKIGKHKEVNTVWLRENCRCHECYNLETQQRNVLFYRLNPGSFEVESLKEAGEGESIEVLWGDQHVSYYDKEWLRSKLANDYTPLQGKKTFLWNANTIQPYMSEKKIDFESLLHDKASLKSACEKLFEYGILQIEKVPKNLHDTIQAAEKISNIKETFYGRTWEVDVEDDNSNVEINVKDTAYTNVAIGPHTDGNYFSEPPSILVFHHLKVAKEGGDLVFVDGFQAAEKLKSIDIHAHNILSNQLINFNYRDETRQFQQTCPTIELDKATGHPYRIRYNHYDRSAHLPNSTIPASEFYEALSTFSHIVDDPNNMLELKPQPGTMIFVHNWRVLHARRSFKGRRAFVGCYLDRDKWISGLL